MGLKGFPLADVVTGLFVVAIVYVLVRPQSKAADMVSLLGEGVVALVATAVGGKVPDAPRKRRGGSGRF